MQFLLVSGWLLLLMNQFYGNGILGRQLSEDKSPTAVPFKTSIARAIAIDFHIENSTTGYMSDEKYSKSPENLESSPYRTSQIQPIELPKTVVENHPIVVTSNSPILTEFFDNETHPNAFEEYSSILSPTGVTMSTKSMKSSTSFAMTTDTEMNVTFPMKEDSEPERVVIGKPIIKTNRTSHIPEEKSLYQKALEMISDTYTLSILVPVAIGILFAVAIITTIAACKWLKRQCRHRRLRKKILPDSVKHLRPSDHAKLLAESSDEEF